MKIITTLLVLGVVVTAFAVPAIINYQGYMTDVGGSPLDTTMQIVVSIYADPDAGIPIWSETHTNVLIDGGIFTVSLGQQNPLSAGIFADETLWLGLTPGNDGEMTPRIKFSAQPYALRVATVDGAAGGLISGDLTIEGRAVVDTILNNLVIEGKANIGSGNSNAGYQAFVTGQSNTASGYLSTVTGGASNTATGGYSSVGGGRRCIANGDYSVVAGGGGPTDVNQAVGFTSTVGGGVANVAWNNFSTVSGGSHNRADGSASVVGGGSYNEADGNWSAVCGGNSGIAGGTYAFVGGGRNNSATGSFSVVTGGELNVASGNFSTIVGGRQNECSGERSVVIGEDNTCSDINSVVCGKNNSCSGRNTFVCGTNANTSQDSCFIFNDGAYTGNIGIQGRRFIAIATNGTYFYTNSSGTTGAQLPANQSAWTAVCDSAKKNRYGRVNTGEVLAKVVQLPVETWSYKDDPNGIRHIGPMAQDFYAAFELGESDTTISTLDPDGIALAAIQELAKQVIELRARVQTLEANQQEAINRK